MRLIGIVRVSSDGQAGENGEGLERQRHALRQIEAGLRREHPDLVVLPPVEVQGVSGSDLADTSAWQQRIVPALRAGTHLMADAIDRIVRASHFDLRTLEAVAAVKGRIFTPGTSYDTGKSTDRMMLTIMAGVSGAEKSELVRRAAAGKEAKRRAGQWVNRLDSTPYGTVYDRDSKRWSYDAVKSGQVVEAFRIYGAGGSLAEAARVLGLSEPGARLVLSNSIYRGILRYDEKRGDKYASKDGRQAGRKVVARTADEIIEVRVYGGTGQADQLIPDERWFTVAGRVSSALTEGRRRRERTAPSIYLSGTLFSAHEFEGGELDLSAVPRHVVYGESGGSDRPTRYACRCRRDLKTDPNAPRPRCCLRYMHAAHVNLAVDAYLVSLTSESWGLEQVREQLRQREDAGGVLRERERLDALLVSLAKQESKLTDLLLEDRVTKEDHDGRQDEIRRKRDAAHRQLASLTKPVEVDLDAVCQAWTYNRDWQPEVKRAWVLKWCRGIVISNSGVESVTLRLPALDGSSVMFTGGGARTWSELAGSDISTVEGRMAGRGRLTAGEVVKRLGWDPGAASINRLSYLVRSGAVPAPSGTWGQKRVWSEAEFDALAGIVYTEVAPSAHT